MTAAEWLPDLLAASFFVPCSQHAGAVVNLFSLTGRRAACPACCVKQNADNLLQVRRSSYHEVVRVSEIARLLDASGVQSYLINQARVIFLNQRPQPRTPKGRAAPGAGSRQNCAACVCCHRNLQSEVATYCSIACKVAQVGTAGCAPPPDAAAPLGGSERAAEAPAKDGRPAARVRAAGVKRPRAGAALTSTPVTPSRTISRRKGNPRRSPEF